MPRDSSESDLVDSTSFKVYGFIQTWNASGGFTVVMRKFCLSGWPTPLTSLKVKSEILASKPGS